MEPFLVPVTENHVAELADFAEDVWHEHYDKLLGKAQVDYMVDKFQSEAAIKTQLANGYEYYSIKDQNTGDMLGFCGIRPEPEEHRLFLSKLYIGAPYRRKGLATMVMAFLEDYGHKIEADRIWLTVNKHNNGSIAAYLQLGFEITRMEVTDIGSGYVMDDYIMEKEL